MAEGGLEDYGSLVGRQVVTGRDDCPNGGVEYRFWPELRHISLNSSGESI